MTSPVFESRLAVLETKLAHLESEQSKMAIQVDEMHSVLMQARGVRWALLTLVAIVSFVGGIIGTISAFMKLN